MKKAMILMILLILSVYCFAGCELNSNDEVATAFPTDAISSTETIENEGVDQNDQVSHTDEAVVEQVVTQIIVDEDADGIQNGYSQDIVIP